MTSKMYPRTLQTALDDTVGLFNGTINFEDTKDSKNENVIGHVVQGVGLHHPLFDDRGLGPDLITYQEADLDHLWVRAKSVFSKQPVI